MDRYYFFRCDEEEHGHRSYDLHHDRQLLEHVLKGQHRIMASLDGLTAAIDKLNTDILDALAGLQSGAISQEAIDAVTDKVTAIDDSVLAATAPAPTPEPAPAPEPFPVP